MKLARVFSLVFLPLFVVAIVFAAHVDADAKRLGGGRSFGSKPSFNKSFSKPVPKQNAVTQQSAASNAGQKSRSGLLGGMGGMFGGLLAGSLLGGLLFGGGFGGVGMFDMLLLFLVIMLAMRFFRNRRAGRGAATGYSGPQEAYQQAGQGYQPPQDSQYSQAESAWDHLRSQPAAGGTHQSRDGDAGAVGPDVPAGFDTEEFLKGAKMVFSRMQSSWDARDMDDIRQFTTPEVYEEIKKQAAEDPEPSRTEVLMVNARLLEVKEEGTDTLATVYIDALMREDSTANQPEQVREVWHFLRTESGNGMWVLDGIQQLEN